MANTEIHASAATKNKSIPLLQPPAHIHFIGICGTAMASLAGILKSQGFHITGSDQNVYPPMSTQLENLGIKIKEGYRRENLEPRPDLVIVGNAITRKHEEAIALLETDIAYTSLPKALGEYAIQNRHSIVVSGTHGKTTTTSMMIKVADTCGIKSGFLVGGIPQDYGYSFRNPEGDHFIIEGDEYDTAFFDKVPKFIHYRPRTVILSGVEFDHADIYSSLDDVMAAFRRLVELIPEDGLLVADADSENVRKLLPLAKCRVITFGASSNDLDYQIVERESLSGRNHFAVKNGGRKIADIAIKLPGEYNAKNATAVFAVARELGWDIHLALQGLASFQGVKRRQEVIGTPKGLTIVEDFAHHPTAVRLTIEAIRERYPGRLISIFEPRSATSRRKVFQKDYVEAFSKSDIVVVATPFNQTNISEADRFSTAELIADLRARGKNAVEHPSADAIVADISKQARKGDTILIMSNGGFDGIYQKLIKALS